MQEGGTSSCRAAGERGRSQSGNVGGREKPKRCLPARFFDARKREAAGSPPSMDEALGCFVGLGNKFSFGLRLLFRSSFSRELLLHLLTNGLGVYLVQGGSILEHIGSTMAGC